MQAFKIIPQTQEKVPVSVAFFKKELFLYDTSYTFKSMSFTYQKHTNEYLFYLHDGTVLACSNTPEVHDFITQNQEKERFEPLQILGVKIGIILPAIALIAALIYGSYNFFLPTISKEIAMGISQEHAYALGEDTLEALDANYLTPSALPQARQDALRTRFLQKLVPNDKLPEIQIVFRSSKKLGANALALPNATVVLLDDLVALAHDDDEIFAIVAHEIGHIYHRHALRQLIQDSVLYVGLVFITGDVTSFATVAGLLPVVLLQQHYSKDFEREADTYAYNMLVEQNIDPQNFISMLEKIAKSHKLEETQEYYYLSSHPDIQERKKIFMQKNSENTF